MRIALSSLREILTEDRAKIEWLEFTEIRQKDVPLYVPSLIPNRSSGNIKYDLIHLFEQETARVHSAELSGSR